jgi:hypothetical protein
MKMTPRGFQGAADVQIVGRRGHGSFAIQERVNFRLGQFLRDDSKIHCYRSIGVSHLARKTDRSLQARDLLRKSCERQDRHDC